MLPKKGNKMTDTKRMIEVLEMIVADVENDVSHFEGKPFNGKTVAEYLGCQAAAIQALAKIVHNDIESRPTKHETDLADNDADEYCPDCEWLIGYCECKK